MEKILVVDASALLAIYLEEASAERVADALDDAVARVISTVTVTEVLIRLFARQMITPEAFASDLASWDVRVADVTLRQAVIAAGARNDYPLNLGDCFVYALAVVEDATILTLDSDFKKCDVPLLMP